MREVGHGCTRAGSRSTETGAQEGAAQDERWREREGGGGQESKTGEGMSEMGRGGEGDRRCSAKNETGRKTNTFILWHVHLLIKEVKVAPNRLENSELKMVQSHCRPWRSNKTQA